MGYRIPPNDIIMASDGVGFATLYNARIPLPISQLGDLSEAFNGKLGSLYPGDKIVVHAYRPMKKGEPALNNVPSQFYRLSQIATFYLAGKTVDEKTGQMHGIFTQVGTIDLISDDGTIRQLKPRESDQLYKIEIGGGWEVRDLKGNVIEQVVTMQQAVEFIQRSGCTEVPGPTPGPATAPAEAAATATKGRAKAA